MLPFEVIPIIEIPGFGDKAAQVRLAVWPCGTANSPLAPYPSSLARPAGVGAWRWPGRAAAGRVLSPR